MREKCGLRHHRDLPVCRVIAGMLVGSARNRSFEQNSERLFPDQWTVCVKTIVVWATKLITTLVAFPSIKLIGLISEKWR